jgi:hypothetical protein
MIGIIAMFFFHFSFPLSSITEGRSGKKTTLNLTIDFALAILTVRS